MDGEQIQLCGSIISKQGTYSEMSGAYWIVDEFSAADGKLEYGKTNNMNLRVIEKQA